mmetsp:Transcript_13610/g.20719  ORF Transcript_13610/g.20719 Transcript_13610/m.20719 type:complete len:100 (+) Transcript_13610:233-532(+)
MQQSFGFLNVGTAHAATDISLDVPHAAPPMNTVVLAAETSLHLLFRPRKKHLYASFINRPLDADLVITVGLHMNDSPGYIQTSNWAKKKTGTTFATHLL